MPSQPVQLSQGDALLLLNQNHHHAEFDHPSPHSVSKLHTTRPFLHQQAVRKSIPVSSQQSMLKWQHAPQSGRYSGYSVLDLNLDMEVLSTPIISKLYIVLMEFWQSVKQIVYAGQDVVWQVFNLGYSTGPQPGHGELFSTLTIKLYWICMVDFYSQHGQLCLPGDSVVFNLWKRKQGKPLKRFKDCKGQCKQCRNYPRSLSPALRTEWRALKHAMDTEERRHTD